MTLNHEIARGRDRLVGAGIRAREADLDARLLARHVLGWDTARLLIALREAPPPGFAPAYDAAIARRERREPTAQIVGIREFWGLPFEVTSDVLVPRPETELLVEAATAILRESGTTKTQRFEEAQPQRHEDTNDVRPRRHEDTKARGQDRATSPEARAPSPEPRATSPEARAPIVADVGTGSGCVAIALAREHADAFIIATDLSEAALRVAARNVARFDVGDRVRLVRTDLLAGIRGGLDLVVSNPPYVADEETPALSPEVRQYEPARALFGGPGGVQVIGALLDQAVPLVRAGGWIVFEFGNAQDEYVERLIAAHPRCALVDIRSDLQGIPRAALVRVKSTC